MADQPTENMVLRTVYLPQETDFALRAHAFSRGVSKGELIRELIDRGLAEFRARGELSLAERMTQRAEAVAVAREGAAPRRRGRKAGLVVRQAVAEAAE